MDEEFALVSIRSSSCSEELLIDHCNYWLTDLSCAVECCKSRTSILPLLPNGHRTVPLLGLYPFS